MTTYADRIAELKERHAAQLRDIEGQATLAEKLPAEAGAPYMIHFTTTDCPWVLYKVKTLADALPIVRAFSTPLNVSAISDGCLSVQPVGRHGGYEGKPARWGVPQSIAIRQHGGRGFDTAEVSFWCAAAGRECIKVCIDVANLPYQYRSHMNVRYDTHGDVIQAAFIEGGLREQKAAARVKYGAGSRDAFDISYFFSGVGELERVVAAAEQAHA